VINKNQPPLTFLTSLPTQSIRGCDGKLLHILTCIPTGAEAVSTVCNSFANTALPEPVIRP
jgi:hypothetical protein